MTVYTLKAEAPAIELRPGQILRLEAIDPTTGNAVAGVEADRWAIYGRDESEPATLDPPLPILVLPVEGGSA